MTIYNVQKDTEERIAHVYVCKGKELIEVPEIQAGDIGCLLYTSVKSIADDVEYILKAKEILVD